MQLPISTKPNFVEADTGERVGRDHVESIQGNVKPARSLVEPLQVGMDNGARRALIPIENKRSFFDVSAEVLENVDPIFFGNLRQAAFKALGLS